MQRIALVAFQATAVHAVPGLQATDHRLHRLMPLDPAYAESGISQRKRKLIEQGFGWAKFIGPIRQVKVRGMAKVDQVFMLAMTGYDLVRMRTLAQVRLQHG